MVRVMTFSCLVGTCPRDIPAGLFCAEHAYLADGPLGLWAVRVLSEHDRELRGLWCNDERWGVRR